MYDDGRFGVVKPYLLDNLLDEKKVTSFLRSDGWVVVGRDLIRSRRSSQGYDGAERRVFYTLNAPLERELVVKLLQEIAWIVGPLVLISILLSGLL
jgi:hypothetical protein